MGAIFWAFLFGAAAQTSNAGDASLFYGSAGCLAVRVNQQLNAGERLLILAPGVATEARAGAVRTPTVGSDCWNPYRAEQPDRVSSLPIKETLGGEAFFAIRPADALIFVGGAAVKGTPADTERWLREVSPSLPDNWRVPSRLAQAYRYGPQSGGPHAIELYVGLPRQKRAGGTAIDAIVIRRFFIVEGRVLASHEYERVSGREERVDTEPPSLTIENWSASETERTVGYLTKDDGRTWVRLSTNVGFEGIWWIAQALRPGLSRTFEQYLSTHH